MIDFELIIYMKGGEEFVLCILLEHIRDKHYHILLSISLD